MFANTEGVNGDGRLVNAKLQITIFIVFASIRLLCKENTILMTRLIYYLLCSQLLTEGNKNLSM